ncbi:MAG: transcription termination/antitermination protein NusG [Oscillospiraceae bacterium]|nr:transcription termination/antitermination protein NusG [Oscillospiraceae bacterium]
MTNTNTQWFIVHTYSGYENKVKANLEKIIENRSMQEVIEQVKIPMEEVTEIKDGVKRVVQRKKYPGYVFIKMDMNEETWFIVRNTRGVTGFVGPASKAVSLTNDEIEDAGVEKIIIKVDYQVGDTVLITGGPLENFKGKVKEIDMDKKQVSVTVAMFGRETDVDLEFDQVELEN